MHSSQISCFNFFYRHLDISRDRTSSFYKFKLTRKVLTAFVQNLKNLVSLDISGHLMLDNSAISSHDEALGPARWDLRLNHKSQSFFIDRRYVTWQKNSDKIMQLWFIFHLSSHSQLVLKGNHWYVGKSSSQCMHIIQTVHLEGGYTEQAARGGSWRKVL